MATVLDSPEAVLPPMTRPELLGIHLFDLTDRVAVVTGAGRGLGQAMALALAAAGADVVVSSRTYSELETLRDTIRDLGPRAEAIAVDCTQEASCEQLVSTAIERLGKVDILVNNAGINVRKPILDLSAEEFDRVLTTNLYGYFYCARAGRPAHGSTRLRQDYQHFEHDGPGSAADPGRLCQLQGRRRAAHQCPGARVGAMRCPGQCHCTSLLRDTADEPVFDDPERNRFIRERTPMGRWGQPHELAGAVIFLASDASSFVTGHVLKVDGGWNAW